jgi:DNA-binding NarL/FixJ family response regulator
MPLIQTYLVEDSPLIRESLIATLEELAPVKVVGSAEDEDAALRWLELHVADLVIVDLFLKSGSGLGVLRAAQSAAPLRGRGRHHVVLSNYATPAMRERCLALGADGVFDKSTEIDGLLAYCNALAERLV